MAEPRKKLAREKPTVEQALQDGPLAEMIAAKLADEFCFAPGLGWLHWSGKVWDECSDVEPVEAVRVALRDFMAEEILHGASPGRTKSLEVVLGSGKIRSVAGLLKGILKVEADEFDTAYDLLNVANGVVDLRTGELLAHDPAHRFTKIARAEYDPAARSRFWNLALSALPREEREWMKARLGQAITGYPPSDDLLPISRGSGSNGKSTFFDAIRFACGTFAGLVSDRVLIANPGDHPTELTDLRGLRLAVLEELPEGGRLNVKRLKDIIGTESITARKIRQDSMTWRATHSPFITTNYTPRVNETDHGTWRRLALVRFPYTFRKPGEPLRNKRLDKHGDPQLKQRTRQRSMQKAALRWLVEGAMAWYAADQILPPTPPAVAKATEEWRAQADHVFAFASEYLTWDPARSILSSDLTEMFRTWLSRNGKPEWAGELIVERFGNHHLAQDHGVRKARLRVKEGQLSRPMRSGPHFKDSSTDIDPVGKSLAQWIGVAWRGSTEGD
ncbi:MULTISPECIES: DNA primase family protein [unclassified Microbacterium]|uniref:DNA primase family protein n=1 Tax=unclassified Microbacterium TaxID=2609290 RepID=UPI0030189D01